MQAQPTTMLDRFMPFGSYLSQRQNIFPGVHSGIWFERQNRKQLLKSGAVLLIRGRKWVDPAIFDAQVLEIARARAKRAQKAA